MSTAVLPQVSTVPREPTALAQWLRSGIDGSRIWQALAETNTLSTSPGVREVVVDYLLDECAPSELERGLTETPAIEVTAMGLLAADLGSSSLSRTERLQAFIAELAASRSRRIGSSGEGWSPSEYEGLLRMQFVDPERFVSDTTFREKVLDILPAALDTQVPQRLKDLLLFSVNNVPGIDFAASDRIETAWKAISRSSQERESTYQRMSLCFSDDYSLPIEATVTSLPSRFFDAAEVIPFLECLRSFSPKRKLLALVDLPLREQLSSTAERLGVDLIETHGRRYTPWPRDPLCFARGGDDRVIVLVPPAGQMDRQEDLYMGLELVQGLPSVIDESWGGIRWARSPVPFHNGQVLLTPERAWVSLHSLEPRILQLLSLDEVPGDAFFGDESIWRDYLLAAKRAAGEMEVLFGREVRFVHPLPDGFESPLQVETMGGGAGFDLDSLLTIVEVTDDTGVALVGDLAAGTALLRRLTVDDLTAFRTGFGLSSEPQVLRRELISAQDSDRARRLRAFLDLVDSWLREEGFVVHRLPLFLVSVKFLGNAHELHHEDFLITWANVVLENLEGRRRAEGFSNLLPMGDRLSREVFQQAGYEMNFIPPLVRSIILNGGYRCASQSLRSSARESVNDD
jgi:hypothetical protein